MSCSLCQSKQTFNRATVNFRSITIREPVTTDDVHIIDIIYKCSACQIFTRTFLIKLDYKNQYIMKVGQEPSWEISVDRNLEKMLGAHVVYYKKGLTCESQSYGIGAFSYYRRIVEEIIDNLLEEIADLISGEEKDAYLKALEATKKTRVAQEKIALVKDLLPLILRPNGMNPLSVLHSTLSKGLHAESDERCIELAMTIREALVFLVNQVINSKSAASSFTDSMRKLLDEKTKQTIN